MAKKSDYQKKLGKSQSLDYSKSLGSKQFFVKVPLPAQGSIIDKKNVMDLIGKKSVSKMMEDSLNHRRDSVFQFVREGLHVNAVDTATGVTPLHCAAMFGDRELADALLEKGADVRAIDKKGRAPGDIAIDAGEYEMSEYLTRLECKEIGRRKRKAAGLEP